MNRLGVLLCVALFAAHPLAEADCFAAAAAFHHVNPLILRAIALVESGDKPPTVTNRNSNGSIDYGRMQINSIHLPELARYGVTKSDLFDACTSIYTGAWILRRNIDKYGNTWAAVGAYNSATPYLRDRYAEKVMRMVQRLVAAGYTDGLSR